MRSRASTTHASSKVARAGTSICPGGVRGGEIAAIAWESWRRVLGARW